MAGKTIEQLTEHTTVSGTDYVIVQKRSFPSGTRKAQVANLLKGGAFVKKPLIFSDADWGYVDNKWYEASAVASRSDWLARLNQRPGQSVVLNQVMVDLQLVGGGGGGSYGGTTGYGGFPGQVLNLTFPLSDFSESIPITVGAGGNPGSPGGITQIELNGLTYRTNPADRGGNNDAEENSFFSRLQPMLRFIAGRRTDVALTTAAYAPNNGYGPGFGGGHNTARPFAGGGAGHSNGYITNGPSTAGASGYNGYLGTEGWDSFGTGGAGHRTGIGGNGGAPGGGGGSGNTGGSATNGKGGAGVLRARFWAIVGS